MKARPYTLTYPSSTEGRPSFAQRAEHDDWVERLHRVLAAAFADKRDLSASVFVNQPRADDIVVWSAGEPEPSPVAVFGVVSPVERVQNVLGKTEFYARHGVGEYYLVDPEINRVDACLLMSPTESRLHRVNEGFVSPRLGVRLDAAGEGLRFTLPDGREFVAFAEVRAEQEAERRRRELRDRLGDLNDKISRNTAPKDEIEERRGLRQRLRAMADEEGR